MDRALVAMCIARPPQEQIPGQSSEWTRSSQNARTSPMDLLTAKRPDLAAKVKGGTMKSAEAIREMKRAEIIIQKRAKAFSTVRPRIGKKLTTPGICGSSGKFAA